MKPGDLVRFKPPYYINVVDGVYSRDPVDPGWQVRLLGILLKHEKWEKMSEVLWQGHVVRLASRDVEKFGRKGLKFKYEVGNKIAR